jgi:fructan beta-fructosidase
VRASPGRTALARVLLVAALAVTAVTCAGDDSDGSGDPSSTPSTSTSAGPATTRAADAEGTAHWRPEAHFTPPRNWMNDPNGLVYHDGAWHLFYQHNPQGNGLGNMSWGHASSPDLATWADHPVAIEATGSELVFSGSVVVDRDNTSGLGTGDEPPLVAVYTSVYGEGSGLPTNTQAQSLAYSTDGGETWERYEDNPVLRLGEPEARSFRDPKVFWYEPGGYWVMAAVVADTQVVKLFRSDDLIHWDHLSDIEGIGATNGRWEMPDLFPLPLDGEAGDEAAGEDGDERWVLVVNLNGGAVAGGSGAQYFVGDFDGTTFRPDDAPAPGRDAATYDWVDHGADFYAAGTWNDAPEGGRVGIAWMSNWDYAAEVPTDPWRGAMTHPRRLALRTIGGEARLVSEPVAVGERPEPSWSAASVEVDDAIEELPADARGVVAEVDLVIEPGSATAAGVAVRRSADGSQETRITYDPAAGALTVDRSRSGEAGFSPRFSTVHTAEVPPEAMARGLDLRILVDRSSVEVFAAGGAVTFTEIVLPDEGSDGIALVAEGGAAAFRDVEVRHP